MEPLSWTAVIPFDDSILYDCPNGEKFVADFVKASEEAHCRQDDADGFRWEAVSGSWPECAPGKLGSLLQFRAGPND